MKHRGRAIHGILLLDKPQGLSSNQALQRVRHALGAAKGGHTGALDPLATGMLPLCFGEATRLAGLLLTSDKAYLTEARLGARTTTGDAEGELIDERPVPDLDASQIEQVLARFRGDIEQVPPMYSALKHQGRTLYSLARKGVEVERAARRVRIHDLRCNGASADRLQLEVTCSKGTYIRTLVEDIGEALGCGAHVSALRRTWVAPFQGQPMHALDELLALDPAGLEALLLPTDAGLASLPRLDLDDVDSENLTCGRPLRQARRVLIEADPSLAHAEAPGQPRLVRVYGARAELLAVAELHANGLLQVKARFGTGAGGPAAD
jgi:tRNA pseudouridine55 synthase